MTTYRRFDWDRARKDFFTLFTDFFTYNTTDWTLTTTEAGAGAATEAVGNLAGGILVVTNDDADNDFDGFQWAGGAGATKETFKWTEGKSLQFVFRGKVSDATQCDLMMGLYITDTTPVAGVTDGIFFRKDDDATRLKLVIRKNDTETLVDTGYDLVADTYFDCEFYYDGSHAKILAYVNGTPSGSGILTNVPDDEELALSFAFQNGAAAAKVLSVDYIGASQQR